MSTYDLLSDDRQAGSSLRNEAANFLTQIYGKGQIEQRVRGKKADAFFSVSDFGKLTRLYVEAKDYKSALTRSQIVSVWSDYSGIIDRTKPSTLLVVTRNGLTCDAQAFTDEQPCLRHLTIWELEDEVLGLTPYTRALATLFSDNGLDTYYVPAAAQAARYTDYGTRALDSATVDILGEVQQWLASKSDSAPLAILGGYGAGKTSFSQCLIAQQAAAALNDPLARRPVLIKLGTIARYSNLDGLLGAMFTSEHSVKGYSFARFTEFNRRGRLLIILDGFDEMKHAMTWGDFRAQVQELNRLIVSSSKVVLLGRPSAFLSETEHTYVLRGRRRTETGISVKLPEWPEFREYELSGFTPGKIAKFIQGYLSYLATMKALASPEDRLAWTHSRVDAVREVVKIDPDLFSRPVHIKLLVDIAASDGPAIEALERDVSRWNLYQTFFAMLIDRENLKDARRPISDNDRFSFIQKLASWLWLNQDGATSFCVADLPATLLHSSEDHQIDDEVAAAREMLSGSFLEKKSGDVFYFPHRSFAEFLVAHQMASAPSATMDHSANVRLFKDGVEEFLRDRVTRIDPKAWMESFGRARFVTTVQYLSFLCDLAGSPQAASDMLSRSSHWRPLLAALGSDFSSGKDLIPRACHEIVASDDVSAALVLGVIAPSGVRGSYAAARPAASSTMVAAALLTRVFRLVEDAGAESEVVVEESAEGVAFDMVRACLTGPSDSEEQRVFSFDWAGVEDIAAAISNRAGVGVVDREPSAGTAEVTARISLDVETVVGLMHLDVRELAKHFFVDRRKTIADIIAVRGIHYGYGYGVTQFQGALVPKASRKSAGLHPEFDAYWTELDDVANLDDYVDSRFS